MSLFLKDGIICDLTNNLNLIKKSKIVIFQAKLHKPNINETFSAKRNSMKFQSSKRWYPYLYNRTKKKT